MPGGPTIEATFVCLLEQFGQVARTLDGNGESLEVPRLPRRRRYESNLKAEIGERSGEVRSDIVVGVAFGRADHDRLRQPVGRHTRGRQLPERSAAS